MNLPKTKTLCILCALVTFLASECISQVGTKDLAVKEAQEARESAERRSLELELELRKMRGELDALRSRYAALYVESHQVLRNLREMEANAARLIQKKQSEDSGKAEVLEALDLMVRRQLEVRQTLLDFEKCLSSLLEVLQPSEAVKSELEQRLAELKKSVEKSLETVPQVIFPEKGGNGTAQVLSVNRKDEMVILDKGTLNGVRPGKVWCLLNKEGVVAAKVRTVACRQNFCAAVLLEGGMNLFNEGMVLSPEH